jgi:hypothetical protein
VLGGQKGVKNENFEKPIKKCYFGTNGTLLPNMKKNLIKKFSFGDGNVKVFIDGVKKRNLNNKKIILHKPISSNITNNYRLKVRGAKRSRH